LATSIYNNTLTPKQDLTHMIQGNSVVVLEPGGRQGRQLISSDDGLSGPTGLHFDKSETSLLVSTYNRPAFLYHMC
jgi:hypothetical protein